MAEHAEPEDPKAAYLGSFRLLQRVATGGMAEVFAARVAKEGAPEGTSLGDLVALKRLLPGVDEDIDLVEMFHSEALLSSKLSHPQIARCFGLSYVPVTDEPFLVMEFVQGVDLGEVLQAKIGNAAPEPIDGEVLAAIGLQTAEALAYVQGLVDDDGQPLGVVHRDISPQNLRIQPDGLVKLLDFGIARFVGRSTDTLAGVLKGKHAYMSPEQVEGLELDGRSDLFALGVLLHELSTGRRLFRADTVPDTLNRVRRCEVPDLTELRPDLDPELAHLIMSCLSRDPQGRPLGASVLVERFRGLLQGGLVEAQEVVSRWVEATLGAERGQGPIPDEIGAYYASLISAEDKGEETTDQIGVADATRVYRYGEEPPAYAPVPLSGQVRWLLYLLTAWAVLCVLWMIF
jgi:eukaryotic-like serine/threonine-protein kinase